ncbi:hypothetical protein IKG38_03565 [Candidatus Saccharibacteria bacterium]|nr:hypothetical protein [Candidatus Saccharibacteria bacterium]
MNLLTNKLKYTQREITNLKTAHKRGLGLLKVYRERLLYSDTAIPNYYQGNATLTVDFDQSFGAYPFAYVEGRIDGERDTSYEGWYSANMKQMRYTNNGHRAIFTGDIWYYGGSYFDRLYVYSTAPIISISIVQS